MLPVESIDLLEANDEDRLTTEEADEDELLPPATGLLVIVDVGGVSGLLVKRPDGDEEDV